MRHRKNNVKLGRSAASHRALLNSLVGNFITEQRITTTVPKAKLARSLAEKMVTVAKKGLGATKPELALKARRDIASMLPQHGQVKKLFETIAPQYKDRAGGFTRIVRLGVRGGDGSEMAILEWVDLAAVDRRRKPKADKAGAEGDAKTPEGGTGESKKES